MVVRLKLACMGLLLAFAVVAAMQIGHAWQWLVCLALVFSLLGDALLARVRFLTERLPVDPFLAGMGSFALAQICYSIAFWKSMQGMPALNTRLPGMAIGAEVLPWSMPVYLLVGLLCWTLVVLRSGKTADLKAASLVYCCLLCAMASFAFSAAFTGVSIVWPLMLGGVLFMVSDGFIAARIFTGRFASDRTYEIAVWGTYLPAQILLTLGTSWLY